MEHCRRLGGVLKEHFHQPGPVVQRRIVGDVSVDHFCCVIEFLQICVQLLLARLPQFHAVHHVPSVLPHVVIPRICFQKRVNHRHLGVPVGQGVVLQAPFPVVPNPVAFGEPSQMLNTQRQLTVRKYGLNMLVPTDDELQSYVKQIMKQLHKWVYGGLISRLVVAIVSKETGETVEKWQFNLEIQKPDTEETEGKPNEQIQREIQAIIRQITASVTFLPELEDECTFNVLVYADPNCRVPEEWGDSRTHEITGVTESVKFRSFSTTSHRVDALVEYKHG
ncbi:hypothetical protein KL928_003859 [Ogataea angusta]|uniref:HORMA domain-containing protein n=1 Tax=Pichia angusta TaxID=870730 RepID=A0AAN6I578_PICAN|nr:uncharacterized protein KL928_003859 [Ogataea angusta]KAG7817124.1 hypothetical protein KL928_003859 [Ogataea angusta]